MLTIRKAAERGHADHGWLKAAHTFSFADYRDPRHMGFRFLRVMNEDRIAPGQGFGTHAHHDMEIVTYVLEGALEHKDSMGNGAILRPGEFQRITAGSGITHSEFNPSADQPTHLYQIWLFPERRGLEPGYEQKRFDAAGRENRIQLVASRDGAEGSLLIHQDARVLLADLAPQRELNFDIAAERHVWLQVLRGAVTVNGQPLGTSDAVAASAETQLKIVATDRAELMVFDLA